MKAISTKILLLSVVSLLLINCFSCKKSNSESVVTTPIIPTTPASEYFLECKINGELKTFNASLIAKDYLQLANKHIQFSGYIQGNTGPFFEIKIGSFDVGVLIIPKTYTKQSGMSYFSAVYFNTAPAPSLIQNYPTDFQVTITEINNTFVKGTFSGTLTNGNNTVIAIITEGKFSVKHCTVGC
jgi:hypothetical protein